MKRRTFLPSKEYLLPPIEMGSDRRYWKHRAALKAQASKHFPPHTRYEVLMTLQGDFGWNPAVAVVRGPRLDRDGAWKQLPFPAYKHLDQRLDRERGVYVLARSVT